MEFSKLIEVRRSVRGYDAEKKVTKEQVEEILKKAQLAPSWKNTQTGKYYVVLPGEKLEKVRAAGLPEFNQKNSSNAALIVTAYEKEVAGFINGEAANEVGDSWGAYDLGLQNSYFVLAAADAGLDTLIMGIRNEAALREELNIPDSEAIVSVIAIGYGAKEPTLNPRKDLTEIAKFYD